MKVSPPQHGLASPSVARVSGAARDWLVADSLRVLTYRETGGEWKQRLSDHCPVSVRLRLPD